MVDEDEEKEREWCERMTIRFRLFLYTTGLSESYEGVGTRYSHLCHHHSPISGFPKPPPELHDAQFRRGRRAVRQWLHRRHIHCIIIIVTTTTNPQ